MARGGDVSVARRYAEALLEVAKKRGQLAEVEQGVQLVAQAAQSSPQLLMILSHPRVSPERKQKLLHDVFGGRVPQDVERFLMLLLSRQRIAILPQVGPEFARLVNQSNRSLRATATSAVPMTESQVQALQQRIHEATGFSVQLQTRVDPEILGGLVVRVGDKLIDGSVQTQLQRMSEQLKRAKVT